jgi:hypothetical protein
VGQFLLAKNRDVPDLHRTKCVGVDHASTAPGANIAQFNCESNPQEPNNQLWLLVNERIINNKSGKCIGVDHASTAIGAQLKQFDCDSLDPLPPGQKSNQVWHITFR